MIDFRYHLISIIAVFLALAVGIVLGTGPLNKPITSTLDQTQALRADKEELRAQVQQLRQDNDFRETFVKDVAPSLTKDKLRGERVVVIAMPGADQELTKNTVQSLGDAGADVSGTVSLTGAYVDPQQESTIDRFVARLVPAGVKLPSASSDDAYDRVAVELSAVLLTRKASAVNKPIRNGPAVLAGMKSLGLLDTQGAPGRRASLAVLVAGTTPVAKGGDPGKVNDALVRLAQGADDNGEGTVVEAPLTGAKAAAKGVIAALRDAGAVGRRISSVDVADSAAGQVAMVLALDAERQGESGHYGIDGSSDGPLPKLPDSTTSANGP